MSLSGYSGKIHEVPAAVRIGWPYLRARGTFLDCRGPLDISEHSFWGYGVWVLTQSHDISGGPGVLGKQVDRGVTVADGAWIGSRAVLSGCSIGTGAVVAAGTVVRGQNVAPGVIVAGNPARVIARWNGTAWEYLPETESGFGRELK